MPTDPLIPAPPWRRLIAAVYDLLPLAGLWMVGTALAVLAARLVVPSDRIDLVLRDGWPHVALQAWLLLLTAGYFVGSWRRGGQTIGMRPWRLTVQTEQGGALDARTAWRRAACGWFLPGLIWCWFDPRRRALHDRFAGTVVVLKPKASPQK